MAEQTTARMIDAIEHPLTDKTISITTRAQPWVDELIRKAKAEALREAAEDLKPGGGYPGYRIQYWLRNRAKQLEGEQ